MVSVFLAGALVFSPGHALRTYQTAAKFVERCPFREAGTPGGHLASHFILDEASKLGADVRRDCFLARTPKGDRWLVNLYAEFKTDDDSPWVILLSHFDTKPGTDCPGANDGASTSALLVTLAGLLADRATPKGNVLLVWTDGEECFRRYDASDGLWGARRAAERVAAKGVKVRAVICLDMLGDRDLKISIPANGTGTLAQIAVCAAERAGCPGLVTRMAESVKDDHVAFLDRGFKAIDLIDFEYGPANAFWHTSDDCMANVSESSLLKSGRVVSELLNVLL